MPTLAKIARMGQPFRSGSSKNPRIGVVQPSRLDVTRGAFYCSMVWIVGDVCARWQLLHFSRRKRGVDFLEHAFFWSNALLELVIFLERWLFL